MLVTKLFTLLSLLATQGYAAPLFGIGIPPIGASGSANGGVTVGGNGNVGTGGIVGGLTGTTGNIVGGAQGAAGQVVGGAAGTAGQVVGGAAGTAGQVVGGAAGTAGQVVGGAAGTAGQVVGGAAGTAGQVVGGATGTAGQVVGGAQGSANAGVNATIDLMVFIDGLLKVTTGDASATLGGLVSQLALTAGSSANALTTYLYQECLSAHSDSQTCLSLAAFLAASINAELSGMTGVDLFATLGRVRITNLLHALQGSVCSTEHQLCDPLTVSINAFLNSLVNANANVHVNTNDLAHLQALGYLGFIDNPSSLLNIAGIHLRSLDVDADTDANVLATVKVGSSTVKVVSFADVFANAHVSRSIAVNSNTNLNAFTGATLNNGGLNTGAVANAASANTVKLGNTNVNANAFANVLANAHATKRSTVESRIILLNRPLTANVNADADINSKTTLKNGQLNSNTIVDADAVVGVFGRDLGIHAFTTGAGAINVGDIIVDGNGFAHIVADVTV